MDGMHRVTRALAEGIDEIRCVRFETTPSADYVDVQPAEVFATIEQENI